MEFPLVGIMLITYDRPKEIRRVVDALRTHIQYPPEQLRWHLADDESPKNYIPLIQRDYPDLHFTATVTQRKGWGANVNKALHYVKNHLGCDYIFSCEDDYVAIRDLNLRDGVLVMEEVQTIGLVRYDGVSAHYLNLRLREAKLPTGRHMDYLIIDRDSPHLNVYSHRPHLKHYRFHGKFGYYKEGRSLGYTEVDFAHHVKNVEGDDIPLIVILPDGIPRAFDHVGHSRQGTELDHPT